MSSYISKGRVVMHRKKNKLYLTGMGSKIKNKFPWAGDFLFAFFIVRVSSLGILSQDVSF